MELYSARAETSSHPIYKWWPIWQEIMLRDTPNCFVQCLQKFKIEYGGPYHRDQSVECLHKGLNRDLEYRRPRNEAWFSELEVLVTDLVQEYGRPDNSKLTDIERHMDIQDSLLQKGNLAGMTVQEAHSIIRSINTRANASLERAIEEDMLFLRNVKAALQKKKVIKESSTKPKNNSNQYAKSVKDYFTAKSQSTNEHANVSGFKKKPNPGFSTVQWFQLDTISVTYDATPVSKS